MAAVKHARRASHPALLAAVVFCVGVTVLAALIPPSAPVTLAGLSPYGTRAYDRPTMLGGQVLSQLGFVAVLIRAVPLGVGPARG